MGRATETSPQTGGDLEGGWSQLASLAVEVPEQLANGKVTVGQFIDLTNYYRDGFVDSLGLQTVAPRHAARQPQRNAPARTGALDCRQCRGAINPSAVH